MEKDKRKAIRVNQIGSVSLILVFTVLCLTVFGVISLTGASADAKLADKNAEKVLKYYEADGEAEERLKEIDGYARKAATLATHENQYRELLQDKLGEGYDRQAGELTYTVEIGEEQALTVGIQFKNFSSIEVDRETFNIKKWIVINKEDYAIDDDMPVWQGEF